jgi:hypothetical protein
VQVDLGELPDESVQQVRPPQPLDLDPEVGLVDQFLAAAENPPT